MALGKGLLYGPRGALFLLILRTSTRGFMMAVTSVSWRSSTDSIMFCSSVWICPANGGGKRENFVNTGSR